MSDDVAAEPILLEPGMSETERRAAIELALARTAPARIAKRGIVTGKKKADDIIEAELGGVGLIPTEQQLLRALDSAAALGFTMLDPEEPDVQKHFRAELIRRVLDLGFDDVVARVDRAIAKAEHKYGDSKDAGGEDTAAAILWSDPIPLVTGSAVPPFPLHALPAWAQAWVTELALETQTPPDLSAALTLAALATACAGRAVIQVRPGWREPLNLYFVCVQPPGSRKSEVFKRHERPLAAWEAQEGESLAPTIAAKASELRAADHRVSACETRLSKANDFAERAVAEQDLREATEQRLRAEAAVPVVPRLLCSDVTAEQLAVLLHAQGGRIALWDAEGCGPFALALGRYSEGGAVNFEIFLRGHAGDALRVDRVKRAPLHVASPALTLAAMAQPALLQSLGERREARGLGLLARILWIMPEPLVGRRLIEAPAMGARAVALYNERVSALLDMDRSADGEPHELRLHADAWLELRHLAEWLEPQLGAGGALESVGDWAAKLAGAVARIAGLLHASEHPSAPWAQPVSGETMRSAVAIGQYLLAHARAAFERMAVDSDTEHAQAILHYLARNKVASISGRDLYRAMRGRFKKAAAMEPVLDLLVEHGFLRVQPQSYAGTGRRPAPLYYSHPSVLSKASIASPMEVESEK